MPGCLGVEVAVNVTDDLWQALGEAFSDAFGKSPIADELQRIADDYQRDAIAGAQSTMPDDEPGEL